MRLVVGWTMALIAVVVTTKLLLGWRGVTGRDVFNQAVGAAIILVAHRAVLESSDEAAENLKERK